MSRLNTKDLLLEEIMRINQRNKFKIEQGQFGQDQNQNAAIDTAYKLKNIRRQHLKIIQSQSRSGANLNSNLSNGLKSGNMVITQRHDYQQM